MDQRFEQLVRRQAIKLAANLRMSASMFKLPELQDKIDGDDKGKTYCDALAQAILKTLGDSKTLTLKPKSAA